MLDPTQYPLLKAKFNQHVKEYLQWFLEEIQESPSLGGFIPYLRDLSKEPLHPPSYYWLHLLTTMYQIEQMIQEECYEDAFHEWNQSEYAQKFFEYSQEKSEEEAHRETLKFSLKDLEYFYFIHIKNEINHPPKEYLVRSDLGDTPKQCAKLNTQEIPDTHLQGAQLSSPQIQRIQQAYIKIQKYSPASFLRLQSFTSFIIPIDQEEIVSYSSQNLPGYSTINLTHRDDIDLLDDLIHENGHHHLNYYLNTQELIEESEDLDYYSPWREKPRPVRGIYHAYMTFYWAYELFYDLYLYRESFSLEEQNKIQARLVEEASMLDLCYEEALLCLKDQLITDEGWSLLLELHQNLENKNKKLFQDDSLKSQYHKIYKTHLELRLKYLNR